MRILVLLAVTVVVCAGCARPHRMQLGDRSGLAAKMVAAKDPPATLVALDGTRCRTTPGRFDSAEIGDNVWCVWRDLGDGM